MDTVKVHLESSDILTRIKSTIKHCRHFRQYWDDLFTCPRCMLCNRYHPCGLCFESEKAPTFLKKKLSGENDAHKSDKRMRVSNYYDSNLKKIILNSCRHVFGQWDDNFTCKRCYECNRNHPCGKCASWKLDCPIQTRVDIQTQTTDVESLDCYTCSFCGCKYSRHVSFLLHEKVCPMRPDIEDRKFCCSVCYQQFRERLSLIKHERTCEPEKMRPYICGKCGKQFTQKHYYSKHEVTCGHASYCRFCSKLFKNVNNRIVHERICPFARQYKTHKKSVGQEHSEQTTVTGGKRNVSSKSKFPCRLCKRLFSKQSYLLKHMEYDHRLASCAKTNSKAKIRPGAEVMSWSCNSCDETFLSFDQLDTHVIKTHTPTYFICEKCDDIFQCFDDYQRHYEEHIGFVDMTQEQIQELKLKSVVNSCYECKCGLSFQEFTAFKQHVSIHTSKKACHKPNTANVSCNYYCQECKLTFKDIRSLKIHNYEHLHMRKRMQTTDRDGLNTKKIRYTCMVCLKKFTDFEVFKQHMDGQCKAVEDFYLLSHRKVCRNRRKGSSNYTSANLECIEPLNKKTEERQRKNDIEVNRYGGSRFSPFCKLHLNKQIVLPKVNGDKYVKVSDVASTADNYEDTDDSYQEHVSEDMIYHSDDNDSSYTSVFHESENNSSEPLESQIRILEGSIYSLCQSEDQNTVKQTESVEIASENSENMKFRHLEPSEFARDDSLYSTETYDMGGQSEVIEMVPKRSGVITVEHVPLPNSEKEILHRLYPESENKISRCAKNDKLTIIHDLYSDMQGGNTETTSTSLESDKEIAPLMYDGTYKEMKAGQDVNSDDGKCNKINNEREIMRDLYFDPKESVSEAGDFTVDIRTALTSDESSSGRGVVNNSSNQSEKVGNSVQEMYTKDKEQTNKQQDIDKRSQYSMYSRLRKGLMEQMSANGGIFKSLGSKMPHSDVHRDNTKKKSLLIYRCISCSESLHSFSQISEHVAKTGHGYFSTKTNPEPSPHTVEHERIMFPVVSVSEQTLSSVTNNHTRQVVCSSAASFSQVPTAMLNTTTKTIYMSPLINKNAKTSNLDVDDNCNENIQQITNLVEKVASDTQLTKVCNICSREFSSNYDFLVHKEICSSKESPSRTSALRYNCNFCHSLFSSRGHLLKHLECHGKNESQLCQSCGLQFLSSFELNKHRKAEHNVMETISRFPCSTCDITFSTFEHLKEHAKICRNDYICETCSKKYESLYQYVNHVRECNRPNSKQSCDTITISDSEDDRSRTEIDGNYYQNDNTFYIDTDENGNNTDETDETDIYQDESDADDQLITNEQEFEIMDDNKCDLCGREFRKKIYLVEHKKDCRINESPNRKPKRSSVFLQRQLRTHSEQFSHMCSKCGVRFQGRFELFRHKRKCRNTRKSFEKYVKKLPYCKVVLERLHVCLLCNKYFFSLPALHSHNKMHQRDEESIIKTHSTQIDSNQNVINHTDRHGIDAFKKLQSHKEICMAEVKVAPGSSENSELSYQNINRSTDGFIQKRFTCSCCNQSFQNLFNMQRHKKACLKTKGYTRTTNETIKRCDPCNLQFTKLEDFNFHKQVCSENRSLGRIYYCKICYSAFSIYFAQVSHTKACKKKMKKGVKKFNCPKCRNIFWKRNSLLLHIPSCKVNSNRVQCKFCHKFFPGTGHLSYHSNYCNAKIEKTGTLTCTYCGKSFPYKSKLNRHEIVCKSKSLRRNNVHKCSRCRKEYSSRSSLRKHQKKCFLTCDLCGKTFKHSSSVLRHRKNCNNKRVNNDMSERNATYGCNFCQKTFFKKEMLVLHEKNCKQITGGMCQSDDGQSLVCKICKYQFFTAASLENHEIMCLQKHQLKCPICLKQFWNNEDYSIHENLCKDRLENCEAVYRCDLCCNKFISRAVLLSHQKACKEMTNLDLPRHKIPSDEHDEKTHQKTNSYVFNFKCATCSRTFKRPEHLCSHKIACKKKHTTNKLYQGGLKFTCLKCRRTFGRVVDLHHHKVACFRIKCEICTRIFDRPVDLKNHQKACKTKHAYKTAAPKIPSNEHHEKKHQKTNSYVFNFKCTTCSKTFKRPEYLCSHKIACKKKHTSNKSYQGGLKVTCSKCRRTFGRAVDLYHHKVACFKIKCKICTRIFDRPVDLKNHQKSCKTKQVCKIPAPNSELRWVCGGCNTRFLTRRDRRRHRITCSKVTSFFKCGTCGKKYMPKYQQNHEQICSKEKNVTLNTGFNNIEVNMYPCDSILELMKNYRSNRSNLFKLDKYLMIPFSERNQFVCGICNSSFNEHIALNKHIGIHNVKWNQDCGYYKCGICSKSFDGFSNYNRHLTCHNSIEMYRCSKCDIEFKSYTAFYCHVNTHIIDIDVSTHKNKSAIEEKQSVIEKTPDSKGESCNIGQSVEQGIEKDSNSSSRENYHHKPGVHGSCSFVNNKGNASLVNAKKKNIRLRRKLFVKRRFIFDRRYICVICRRKFTQMRLLKGHLPIHQTKRYCSCCVCNASFIYSHSLNRHIKRDHGGMSFVLRDLRVFLSRCDDKL